MIWLFAAVVGFPGRSAESQAEDQRALRRVVDRDSGGLGTLYDRHGRAVFSLALRILGDESDAEEVTQDVFAQAWRRAGQYDESRGTVAAWLLVIARTRAIDRFRARRVRPEGRVQDDGGLTLQQLPATEPDVASEMMAAERGQRVRRALEALPFLQRVAIELAYFEGLSQREIAERLEQPLGTVKTRMRLGLLKLRDALVEAQP
ncbi:MAG TPA: sigma-70 family RNA polymerase sigma factor [Vicinamibacterales bacterium]|nr:sigma-70 family RNA polymerase sigma factor [Vicinamibacterales bacterium]